MKLYKDENRVLILLHTGFGAGWSTSWSNPEEFAYRKEIVEFWLEHCKDNEFMYNVSNSFPDNETKEHKVAQKFFESLGYSKAHLSGFDELSPIWVDINKPFRIIAYDGNEDIEFLPEIRDEFITLSEVEKDD